MLLTIREYYSDHHNRPGKFRQSVFVDELERNLEGRVAWVSVWPDNYPGPSVYAVGLRVNGSVFTTIPAIFNPGPGIAGGYPGGYSVVTQRSREHGV